MGIYWFVVRVLFGRLFYFLFLFVFVFVFVVAVFLYVCLELTRSLQ